MEGDGEAVLWSIAEDAGVEAGGAAKGQQTKDAHQLASQETQLGEEMKGGMDGPPE